ncbi:predicted protein, partial [Nematostella vectensis]
ATRAVDGDPNPDYPANTCTHTKGMTDPWWRVDLGSSQPIAEVVITNRDGTYGTQRLWDKTFELRIGEDGTRGGVSNPKCGDVYAIPDARVRSIYCIPAMPGRYLTIKSNVPLLTLCEVEVYTTK